MLRQDCVVYAQHNQYCVFQASFDRQFVVPGEATTATADGWTTWLRSVLVSRCDRSTPPRDVCRRLLLRHVPVIEHLRQYRWRSWLLRDVVAGISSGVILVPQVTDGLCSFNGRVR